MKKIIVSLLSITAVFVFAVNVFADSTVVVTGNTSAGENQPGWMFNRDQTTKTPFEFNTDKASIGNGSLYVLPIGANASDKFVAENFLASPVDHVNSISYDFLIAGNGDASDEEQFYLNVYANIDNSNKFYDCRYDYVPTTGSTSSFTTATFLASDTPVNVQRSGTSRLESCPATLAGMPQGSYIRAFSINVGDTTASDTGLAGYLDKVMVNTDSADTIYDFEPFVVSGEITNPATEGATVSGVYNFTATYNDGDTENDDAVQWAIRQGTCAANTGTVFGNVDGRNDAYTWDGASFSSSLDTTTLTPGSYCFVFNPTDDAGQPNVRETKNFTVVAPTPPTANVPAQCNQTLSYNVINGTNSSNVINGTNGHDLIFARGGSDSIKGNGGDDCIVAGDGSDAVVGGTGNDVILGGEGTDSIQGDGGSDALYGQGGSDSLRGGNDEDTLSGGDGSDALQGEGGNDTLNGGAGADSLIGAGGDDTLIGDAGYDVAQGNAGSDTCTAETEASCEL